MKYITFHDLLDDDLLLVEYFNSDIPWIVSKHDFLTSDDYLKNGCNNVKSIHTASKRVINFNINSIIKDLEDNEYAYDGWAENVLSDIENNSIAKRGIEEINKILHNNEVYDPNKRVVLDLSSND